VAEKQDQDFLQKYFWPIAVVVLVLAVVVVVVVIRAIQGSEQDAEAQLNDNYVEKIEISSTPRAGSGYTDLIVIDGVDRPDCSEEGGLLDCSEDPQPTPE